MSAYTPEHFAAIKAPPKDDLADFQLDDGVDAEEAYRQALANGLVKKAINL